MLRPILLIGLFLLLGNSSFLLAQVVDEPDTVRTQVMDKIRIEPNPYYYFHPDYEAVYQGKLGIHNLPESSTIIRIYSLSGGIVKEFKKTDKTTTLTWDMKTEKGVLINTGLYMIHVQTEGLGERSFKLTVLMDPVKKPD